jgi:hypothetical protein
MGRRFREHWQLLGLVALFIVSRALLASTTGKLSMDPLTFYWQYADPKLLREDLLRTIFYLHSQPPLYNLYLGLGLKLFPKNYSAAFAACQYLISLGFSVALFELMRRLTVPKTLAFLLAAAFILSPPYLSYEHWLFYDFPGTWPRAGLPPPSPPSPWPRHWPWRLPGFTTSGSWPSSLRSVFSVAKSGRRS